MLECAPVKYNSFYQGIIRSDNNALTKVKERFLMDDVVFHIF
jgi:hypothetical protein